MTRKTTFFEGWSWFKFNNLGLAPGMVLKFYTSVAKGLKLKIKEVWGLILTFVEGTGEKLVGRPFAALPPPLILNRIKSSANCFMAKKEISSKRKIFVELLWKTFLVSSNLTLANLIQKYHSFYSLLVSGSNPTNCVFFPKIFRIKGYLVLIHEIHWIHSRKTMVQRF